MGIWEKVLAYKQFKYPFTKKHLNKQQRGSIKGSKICKFLNLSIYWVTHIAVIMVTWVKVIRYLILNRIVGATLKSLYRAEKAKTKKKWYKVTMGRGTVWHQKTLSYRTILNNGIGTNWLQIIWMDNTSVSIWYIHSVVHVGLIN